eukprot:COSAG01_NODE_197_length_22333_cov_45.774759_3_plen_106_part_00
MWKVAHNKLAMHPNSPRLSTHYWCARSTRSGLHDRAIPTVTIPPIAYLDLRISDSANLSISHFIDLLAGSDFLLSRAQNSAKFGSADQAATATLLSLSRSASTHP